jgi:hypothetical protein
VPSSNGGRGSIDDECPYVPLHLPPCEVRDWMDAHAQWTLALDLDMPAAELHALYARFAGSPCPLPEVLSQIAEHPNAPDDLLRELAAPQWAATHAALATNLAAPPDVLASLARSADFVVVEHVAWNPNTPEQELHRLAREAEDPYVRTRAKEALERRRAP